MAGQWKAKTKEVSEVDSSGHMTVRFDVKLGSNVIYPDLTITTTPGSYQNDIKVRCADLITSYTQKQTIPQSETIDLD